MNSVDLFAVFVLILGAAESHPATKRRHLEDFADLVQPGPALEFTYPALAPASICGHNLLIDCQYHDQGIPCKIHHLASDKICGCFDVGSAFQAHGEVARTASEFKDEKVAMKPHDFNQYPAKKHRESSHLNSF